MNGGEQHTSVAAPGVKIVTAWAAVGITSWSDAAAALAALYTLILILEWLWKRLGRPFCEKHGWLTRLKRRRGDGADWPEREA